MKFEWDEEKAAANLAKHGVSFEEAQSVFDDPLYVDFYDPDHSQDEHRYIIIGESQQRRLIIVSYTERDDVIRLISAREVTKSKLTTFVHSCCLQLPSSNQFSHRLIYFRRVVDV
jgi:uncharacterized DUF497 family protein